MFPFLKICNYFPLIWYDFRSKEKSLNLPLNITPAQIFQEKLQCFLGQPASSEAKNEMGSKYKQFTGELPIYGRHVYQLNTKHMVF